MGEYVMYEKNGKTVAHTAAYDPKDGEQEVGRVEAASAAKAEKKFKKQQAADGDVSEPDAEDEQDAADQAREVEESKQDFEVMADPKTGAPFIAGHNSDPAQREEAAVAEPEPDPEPSTLGTFRATDEDEALKKAKGEYKDPSEGAQRGSQTP